MSRVPCVLGCAVVVLAYAGPLAGQSPHVGLLLGRSLVGGSDSRTLVGSSVTGADQDGVHVRGFAEFPLEGSPLSLQADLFYNRLTSGPNTFDAGVNGKAALVDRTIGLTGSLVANTRRRSAVSPYFALGAGVFTTRLGHNPDP